MTNFRGCFLLLVPMTIIEHVIYDGRCARYLEFRGKDMMCLGIGKRVAQLESQEEVSQ